MLDTLGVHNIHMYADLFTVNRDQVVGLCRGILEAGLRIRWTCNSRVDFVDREMLQLMARSGCHFISWGLESGNAKILAHARKGVDPDRARQSLTLAHEAGIRNWGYFIIGLPGETEETIRQTIAFSKSLPLDIALFHIAAPHPGTRSSTRSSGTGGSARASGEEVDMDESTVLDYRAFRPSGECWQKRAFREWAMRPGPMLTYSGWCCPTPRTVKSALSVGLQHLGWAKR